MKKKKPDLAAAISMHAWQMAQSGELQTRRAELATQIAANAVKPIPEAAQLQATIAAEIAASFAGLTPRSPAEIRANDFVTLIAPRLKEFGFDERYRRDGLLVGRDPRLAQQAEILGKIKARFTNCGAIVAMVGPRGTGKTTIAGEFATDRLWEDLALAREVQTYTSSFDRRPVPRRITAYRKLSAIVARFKAFYGDFGTTQMEQLEEARKHLATVEVLVIDELSEVDDDGRFKDRILTDLIDLRYAAKRDTLLISNQTKADFEATANPSIKSRITEHGCVLRCEWQSFRDFPVQL